MAAATVESDSTRRVGPRYQVKVPFASDFYLTFVLHKDDSVLSYRLVSLFLRARKIGDATLQQAVRS